MKNKKGNKKREIFKKILFSVFSIFICIGLVKLLVPKMYLLFINLFGISVQLFSDVIIVGSVISIIGLIGLSTRCIEFKDEYVFKDDRETALEIVKKADKCEDMDVRKYSYVYGDVEDIEIDDITNPNWRRDYGFDDIDEYNDSDVKIYTRKKNH